MGRQKRGKSGKAGSEPRAPRLGLCLSPTTGRWADAALGLTGEKRPGQTEGEMAQKSLEGWREQTSGNDGSPAASLAGAECERPCVFHRLIESGSPRRPGPSNMSATSLGEPSTGPKTQCGCSEGKPVGLHSRG